MKRTVKKARSTFVYHITLKSTQAKKKRKKSNNQIPSISKKKIFEEYKDLKRIFQIELIIIISLDKRQIYNINLKKSKMLSSYFIYPLATKELIVLQKYLQTMLKKG